MRHTFTFISEPLSPRGKGRVVPVTVDLAAYTGRPADDAARDIVFSALAQIGRADPRVLTLAFTPTRC